MPIRNLVVTVYARHSADCPRRNDQYWKRCKCPKWLYINNNGQRSQRSAKARSWERAEETRRGVERDFEEVEQQKRAGAEPKPHSVILLEHAVSRFLAAKKKENLCDSTIAKLTTIFEKHLLTELAKRWHELLQQGWELYGKWKSPQDMYLPQKEIFHDVLRAGGIDVQPRPEGMFHIDIPFTRETMPPSAWAFYGL